MKWIEKIVDVSNYKVKALWSDGIVRLVDFENFIKHKTQAKHSSYSKLLDTSEFARIKCDGTTLYWEDLISYKDIDGTVKTGNLDIAPELVYDLSK